MTKVELDATEIKPAAKTDEHDEAYVEMMPWTAEGCKDRMLEINQLVKDVGALSLPRLAYPAPRGRTRSFPLNLILTIFLQGAITFLAKEYTALSAFCVLFAVILLCAVDMPWANEVTSVPLTMIAFLIGAMTSMLCGYIGMKIATEANVKTTYLCNKSKFEGFKVAFQGGEVLGFVLVGLTLLVLEIIILSYRAAFDLSSKEQMLVLFECVSGYGLGGSTVALFGRVGGGIYTKAADVGADLAGKVENALPEDSPKNPGTIADNVGDNVGDIAGMGADLFGSLAESTCAALVVSSTCDQMLKTPDAIYFPLVVTALGIIASLICQAFAYIDKGSTEFKLKVQLWVSTILMSGMTIPAIFLLPAEAELQFASETYKLTPWEAYACVMMGLWSGLFIGLITEYYTSKDQAPTQALAESCRFGPAPNIINGLALGYLSCVVPILCLAATVLVSFTLGAMYGVALSAIGMLGCLPIALSIDGYGPISDNAGGIAEMSNLDEKIRESTDDLDAAGNTTAAIGKGFAIGSACLVALALFGAFVTRVATTVENDDSLVAPASTVYSVNILEPYTFSGLLLGAMLPYWFSALTMKAVGDAAQDMIEEIKRQIPKINAGEAPNHKNCIDVSTRASLEKMIAPGALVIISPLLLGLLFGAAATMGVLAGAIVSGIQIAFSASNTGGAWDNCKKYVEAGMLKEKDADGNLTEISIKKKTYEHDAAVVGDTVGDPLKDTSGPSINILIKLSAICSLVFGTFIAKYGGLIAGGYKKDATTTPTA